MLCWRGITWATCGLSKCGGLPCAFARSRVYRGTIMRTAPVDYLQIEEMSKDRVADAAPFTQKPMRIDEQLAKEMQVRLSYATYLCA